MRREHMREMQSAVQAEYLSALIEGERRMLMVAIDPEDPWKAFRQMRRSLRREPAKARARIDIMQSDHRIEHTADVIPLQRRAG